ncbi:MAG: Spy/CpxP family protein refolding chaperone [Planctomycetes bacterium]|nr:Spy/CpxP family protein refolding chaperone [Planctomycetota bacterium]
MKTKHLILTVLLAALIVAPLALAAPGDGPRGPRDGQDGQQGQGPRGEGRMGMRPQGPGRGGNLAQMLQGRLGKELNLTDEQKEAIKTIADESKTALQEGRQAAQDAMQALHEAADSGTEAEIIAAGKAAGDALTQQALNKATVSNKIKAELTDEQLAKLEELKAEMKERFEQRRQERGDGDGPQRGKGRRGEHRGRKQSPEDDDN